MQKKQVAAEIQRYIRGYQARYENLCSKMAVPLKGSFFASELREGFFVRLLVPSGSEFGSHDDVYLEDCDLLNYILMYYKNVCIIEISSYSSSSHSCNSSASFSISTSSSFCSIVEIIFLAFSDSIHV